MFRQNLLLKSATARFGLKILLNVSAGLKVTLKVVMVNAVESGFFTGRENPITEIQNIIPNDTHHLYKGVSRWLFTLSFLFVDQGILHIRITSTPA